MARPSEPELVSAREAARMLGVKVATLYAYASRGLVTSYGGARSQGRRYLRADLERLRARHDARAGHAPVAAGALRWGEPVLDSSVTAIDARGPLYRGVPAVDLAARGVGFEAVAELLWSGTLPADPVRWKAARAARARSLRAAERSAPIAVFLAHAARLALADPSRHGATRAAELDRARAVIRALAGSFGPGAPADARPGEPVAEQLARALGVSPRSAAVEALDAALVLLADHELNASSFAARVAASAGADLYACLAAALATASGPLHGAASDRVAAFVDSVGPGASTKAARAAVEELARRGEVVPGSHHPLYPEGDPRAPPLLERARALGGDRPAVVTAFAIERALGERGERANVDLGLVALSDALGAPRGSAAVLFVLGRAAGWTAQSLEQREAGFLLRPRARYVGPPPARA